MQLSGTGPPERGPAFPEPSRSGIPGASANASIRPVCQTATSGATKLYPPPKVQGSQSAVTYPLRRWALKHPLIVVDIQEHPRFVGGGAIQAIAQESSF